MAAAAAATAVLGARGATNPLEQADARMATARSVEFGMTVRVAQAGQTYAFKASGVELLRLHQATITLDVGKLDPAVGNEKLVLIGPRAYLHFGLMDTPQARQAHIKPWVVLDLRAAAGYNPWSLGSLKSFGAVSDVVASGTGNDGGTPVHRYTAKVNLHTAIALNPQLAQLVRRLGISGRLFDSIVSVRFDIGDDGYIHRVGEAFSLPLPGGPPLTIGFDMTMSRYNSSEPTLAAPPASQVMTLSQFERAARVHLPMTA